MPAEPLSIWESIQRTFSEFVDDDCVMMASSLSYYAVFSLPPLLFLVVAIAGMVFGEAAVETVIFGQVEDLMGLAAAEQVSTMLEAARVRTAGGDWTVLISILALVFSATAVFAQLQAALNRAWQVAPAPTGRGVGEFVKKRLLSFGMILGIAFLLLVSLVVSAAIQAMGGMLGPVLPGGLSAGVAYGVNAGLSLVIFMLLFAAIFKWMPDARVRWADVWIGSAVTSLLFGFGKAAIAFYLGRSDTAADYGPAGALAVMMLWVFYASIIVLFGAEFTQVWAVRSGARIAPEPGAVRVVRERRPASGSAGG